MASKKIQCLGCCLNQNWLRILPCGHQLCMNCIGTQCPQCKQPILFPQTGRPGSNLPLKFAGTLTCDLCFKVKDADEFYYCEQCVVLMCSACCLRKHSKEEFPDHQIQEWSSSLRPLQHCSLALHQCSHLEDPMGNQALLKEMIKQVYLHLRDLMKDNEPSVADVALRLEKGYSLQGIGGKESSPGAAEQLENHLAVAKQALVLTNMMKESDQVLPKLRGFKQGPEGIAKMLLNELDFGHAPVRPMPAAAASTPRASGADVSLLHNKPFHIEVSGSSSQAPSVVFGSHQFLVLLTVSSIQVWSIENLKQGGIPFSVGSVTREACNQTFMDAAISEQENHLFVLSRTNDLWKVTIFQLSNCSWLKTMPIEQGNNRSACIGATDTAVAYLVLNSADEMGSVFSQFYRVYPTPPPPKKDYKMVKLLQMNSMGFKRVAAKCVENKQHLVAALQADQPCVHMFNWNGKTHCFRSTSQKISLVSPSPLLNICFRTDEDLLFISSRNLFESWKFHEGVGKKTFDSEIKASFVSNLSILNGRIVGVINQTDRGRLRFVFFIQKGVLGPYQKPIWVPCAY